MSGRPAVFLDRDGTLIDDRHYLRDPTAVQLLPGAAEAVRRLNAAGRAVVVVTNQSGIARGLLTEADYAATSRRLAELLAEGGAQLDAQYHCPHHPDLSGMCECRKPGTLLYHRAAADLGLDLGRSWWIGDRLRDIAAAGALGGRGLLVRTGRGAEEARRVEATLWPTTRDLRSAVGLVLSERGVPDYFPRP